MGKRILQLYADDEDIAIARSRRMNLSALFREFLSIELKIGDLTEAVTKEELITKLKSKCSTLALEVKTKISELENKDKQLKELNELVEKKNKKIDELKNKGEDTSEYVSYEI